MKTWLVGMATIVVAADVLGFTLALTGATAERTAAAVGLGGAVASALLCTLGRRGPAESLAAPTAAVDPPAAEPLLENRPWLALVRECAELFDELDRNRADFDPARWEVAEHALERLREVLERAGVGVIDGDGPFDRDRHLADSGRPWCLGCGDDERGVPRRPPRPATGPGKTCQSRCQRGRPSMTPDPTDDDWVSPFETLLAAAPVRPDPVFGSPAADAAFWPGKQSYPDTCAVRCQEFILEQFYGYPIDEAALVREAQDRGWYTPGHGGPNPTRGGTDPKDVGNLLELHGIRSTGTSTPTSSTWPSSWPRATA